MERGGLLGIAIQSLQRAGLEEGADPRLVALALGYLVRAETAPTTERAKIDGRTISFGWDPDPRVWGLNVFLGLAKMLLLVHGIHTGEPNVLLLAGYLANGGRREAESDHPFVPADFLRNHAQSMILNRSGVYRAS
jgi:hypothetical protein